jgi:hypothetical protein
MQTPAGGLQDLHRILALGVAAGAGVAHHVGGLLAYLRREIAAQHVHGGAGAQLVPGRTADHIDHRHGRLERRPDDLAAGVRVRRGVDGVHHRRVQA